MSFSLWLFFFSTRWNILDFLVVIFSVAGIIMDLIQHTAELYVKPTVVRGLRVLRIIRGKRSRSWSFFNDVPAEKNV